MTYSCSCYHCLVSRYAWLDGRHSRLCFSPFPSPLVQSPFPNHPSGLTVRRSVSKSVANEANDGRHPKRSPATPDIMIVLYYTILYYTILYYTILYYTVQSYNIIWHMIL